MLFVAQVTFVFGLLLCHVQGLTSQQHRLFLTSGNADLGSLNSTTMRWLKKSSSQASGQFWVENISHNGQATYNPSPSTYTVFRNVRDYGAVGE